jgi:AsmA protein
MTGPLLWSRGEARLTAVPVRQALGELAGVRLLDGQGTATLQLGGQGETWGDFIQAVTGRAAFSLGEGSLAGIDVQSLVGLAETPSEPIGIGGGVLKFTGLEGSAALTGGAVETTDLAIKGSDFRIDLDGLLWLPGGAVEGTATLGVPIADGRTRQIPIAVTGTLAHPAFDLDRSRSVDPAPAVVNPADPRG